jgi:hypothetical protein
MISMKKRELFKIEVTINEWRGLMAMRTLLDETGRLSIFSAAKMAPISRRRGIPPLRRPSTAAYSSTAGYGPSHL